MKKGFTLIELLAVIIILAVVALIATPIVLDVVKDTKESAAKSQAYMILDGAKLYYTESMFDNSKKAKLTGVANIYDEISMNGKKPENGKLYINKTGLVAMAVLINNKCYKKEFAGELQITEDQECDAGIANDDVIPTISLELNSKQGNVFNENGWANKDIWVDFNVTDNESGAYSYTWCSDNKECEPTNEPIEKTSGSFIISLESETSYACAYGYDLAGNKSERVCVGPYKIDKKSPTLTAFNEELSINQGDNNLVSSYFTANYSISGGTLNCNPVNTSTLGQGIQTLTCTAIGNNGLETNQSKNIKVKISQFLSTYGGSKYDIAEKIIKDKDGGYILIGYTESNDYDFAGKNKGLRDIYIMKVAPNGTKLWLKTYGGTKDEFYGDVVISTKDDGYILVGSTTSIDGDITSVNKGGYDALIMKLDSNGDVEWTKTFGGSGNDFSTSVIETIDNGYVMLGHSNSNDHDFAGKNKGQNDIFMIKLDSKGNMIWFKTYGGSATDQRPKIIQNEDGAYILVGETSSSNGDITAEKKGVADILVMKLDANGNKMWDKIFGGSAYDGVQDFIKDRYGNFILTGRTVSIDGDMPITNKGSHDVFVMKLDSDCNKIWIKTYGSNSDDNGFSIIQTIDNNYVLAGSAAAGNNDFVGANKGSHDIFVMKLDNNGSKIWTKAYGGSLADMPRNIIEVEKGSYILSGYTQSSNGDIKASNKGDMDMLLLYFNE